MNIAEHSAKCTAINPLHADLRLGPKEKKIKEKPCLLELACIKLNLLSNL